MRRGTSNKQTPDPRQQLHICATQHPSDPAPTPAPPDEAALDAPGTADSTRK
ncbi:hypothetical protein SCATT_29470 [Streptantibioticus cattleyicolor NRRL 8057 = DSM 46488]|uniref:Uncharacterized protein n=1 Tax=Streptantibioticus cattleyicolor (strain ATCC 35852 / DSM 46488 / JCM 4925 / NBRC 14057 / NRRL 8057) TaxID=1003195 RepID=G8WS78_STREN|nr:hypothetical protein SCATT_29470 [Streptantibioticus cattleyicolor NRRL 8057 = DSM 46488]